MKRVFPRREPYWVGQMQINAQNWGALMSIALMVMGNKAVLYLTRRRRRAHQAPLLVCAHRRNITGEGNFIGPGTGR